MALSQRLGTLAAQRAPPYAARLTQIYTHLSFFLSLTIDYLGPKRNKIFLKKFFTI
jgi:hypothetical protein